MGMSDSQSVANSAEELQGPHQFIPQQSLASTASLNGLLFSYHFISNRVAGLAIPDNLTTVGQVTRVLTTESQNMFCDCDYTSTNMNGS